MSNYLTIAETSAFCLTTCKGATAEDRHLFIPWIVAAMRDIGSNRDWVKTEVIYPKDFAVAKPGNLVSTIDLALYDSSDQELVYKYQSGKTRIHTNRFLNNIVNDGEGIIEVSEDGFYFYLSSNATNVAYILVRYFGMPIDQDGYPMIKEDNLLAYHAFCRMMWAMRQDDNRSKIEQETYNWYRERDRVKGNNKMPNGVEATKIAEAWLSLINAPKRPNF